MLGNSWGVHLSYLQRKKVKVNGLVQMIICLVLLPFFVGFGPVLRLKGLSESSKDFAFYSEVSGCHKLG